MEGKQPRINLSGGLKHSVAGLALLCFGLMVPFTSYATHIVGGDLSYQCIGGNQYEVTLMVYRDCFFGHPEADFDDPASIAIFDASNNLQVHLGVLGQILIPFNADDTIRQETDCIIDGNGVCVHRTIYRMTVELPFIEGGYQLVYQRCCRNGTLSNIIDPLQSGATFVAEVSETALTSCNSSPEFREWPPIFICINEPLSYDHSATDADGDSLAYKLCTPYLGATMAFPLPQPAAKPPYDPVIWKEPFNIDNLLGGDDPLAISQEGIISGTPSTVGQFLVGVCVEEYRNGQLIGITRRDFEYNVVDCDGMNQIFTSFTVDTMIECADVMNVSVMDNSIGVPANATISYTVTSDKGLSLSFDEPNPSFQVNGRQTITITQTVDVPALCTITKSESLTLDVEDSGLGFMDTITICAGSSVFLNPDYSDRYTYTWAPTTYLTFADSPNPLAEPEESILYTATVFDPILNCTIEESVFVEVIENPGVTVGFDIEKECGSLKLTFINTSTGADTFIWEFGDPANPDFVSNERDPMYTYPEPGTYDVVLTIPGDDCNSVRSLRIAVAGDDFVDFTRDISSCGPSLIDLNTGLNPLYIYQWEDNPLIPDPTVAIPEVLLREDASFQVTVTDPLNDTCQIEGTVNVTIGDQLVIDLDDTIFTCEAGPIELNPNGDPSLIYMWTPADLLDDPNSFNPTATIQEETRFIAKITDPNDSTCMVRLPVVAKLGLDDGGFMDGDTMIVCDSSSFFINPGANPDLVYVWTPEEGLDDPNLPNPIASPTESTLYTVTVSDSAGVCSLMKSIYIEIVESDVVVDFEISKECGSLTVTFVNTSTNAETFAWTFGDPENPGFVSNEESPSYTYPFAGTFEVELRSNDDPNCMAIRAMRITLTGDDFMDFMDTIRTCDPRNVALNPNRNPNYIYAWQADPAIADTTAANPIVSLSDDRTFFVTVTDPLNDTCTIEGLVHVIADDRFVRNLPDSILACMPGPVELNPNGNPDGIYMWEPAELLDDPTSFNPTATVEESTTFTVSIVDPNDSTCTVNTEVRVLIEDFVKLITTEPVEMACPGDSVLLTAKSDLVDSLRWCDPDGIDLGQGDSLRIAILKSGIYTVKARQGECDFVDSVSLRLRELEFDLDTDVPVCSMDPVTITVTNNTDFVIDTIIWQPDSSIALGQGSETVVVRPKETTSYTASVLFEDGCMVVDSVTVQVSDIDDRFVATATPDTIFFGESTTLQVTEEEGATYQWNPAADVVNPNQPSTQANPTETTTFSVEITDASGCVTTKQVTVVVIMVQCEPPFIFLPNAFSPNADGVNDVLFVRGEFIERMEFMIYDRWGQEVFKSTNPNTGWDGSFNGNELPPDVYGYYLMVECIGGDQHIEKGNVTILQ